MMRKTIINHYPLFAPDHRGEFPFRIHAVGYYRNDVRQSRRSQYHIERYYCGVVLHGRSFISVNGESYCTFTPGDMYIMHRGKNYDMRFDREPRYTVLYFAADGPLLENLLGAYALRDAHHIGGLDCRNEIGAILKLAQEGDGELHQKAAVITHAILRTIAGALHKSTIKTYSPDVQKIKAYLDNHVESMIRIKTLGELVFKSPAHVNRMFRREVGASPYEYHLNRKIELARQLLSHPGMRVKEVAARLCFADQYYFSGLFKKKTGITPRSYRNKTPVIATTSLK